MATYYVRSVGGSDANDGLSFANGWATLQHAFDQLVKGDTLYVCSTSSDPFVISAQLDCDYNGGVNTGPSFLDTVYTEVRGADLSGNPYSNTGRAVVVADSAMSIAINFADTYQYRCRDMEVNGASLVNNCIYSSGGGSSGGHLFDNVWAHHSAQYGIALAGAINTLVNCRLSHNGLDGYASSASPRGPLKAFGCVFDHNGRYGVQGLNAVELSHCLIYQNVSSGVRVNYSSAYQVFFQNCVSVYNGSHGFEFAASDNSVHLLNLVSAFNGGYGFYINGVDGNYFHYVHSIVHYNNTSGVCNHGSLPGYNVINANPLFADLGNGTEDFALQLSSPCLNAGFPGVMAAGGTGHASIGVLEPLISSGGSHPFHGDRSGGKY